MVVYLLFSRYVSCPYFWHVSTMHVLAIDFRRGHVHWSLRSIALQTVSVWSVIPFIHSRHNAKDRSLGLGRDIRLERWPRIDEMCYSKLLHGLRNSQRNCFLTGNNKLACVRMMHIKLNNLSLRRYLFPLGVYTAQPSVRLVGPII